MRQAEVSSSGEENYIGFGGGNININDGGSSGGVIISCKDCGNQAKKDCQHKRCRTCCRSRGLPCRTHINSTWVSAAKRRERCSHQQLSNLSPQQQKQNSTTAGDHHQQLSLMMTISGSGAGAGAGLDHQQYCHHHHSGFAMPTTDHQLPKTSGFHFPEEVRSTSLFQCVRVSEMDNTNEQLAYQTSINVGGHVFNGILCDHGPDHSHYNSYQSVGESSSASIAGAQNQATTTIMEPSSSMYQAPFCAFMAGTQFFPPPS